MQLCQAHGDRRDDLIRDPRCLRLHIQRRLNIQAERLLGREDESPVKVYVYNFRPPLELSDLIGLLKRINGKILRISATLGIEAPIGLPDEPTAILRNLNEKSDGRKSVEEELHLEPGQVAMDYPDLYAGLGDLPRRVFSGKRREDTSFDLSCAYRFPAIIVVPTEGQPESNQNGDLRWYF